MQESKDCYGDMSHIQAFISFLFFATLKNGVIMMTINMTWLEDNLFHRTLSYQEKEVLKGLIHIEMYHKGDLIIHENQHVDGLFILNTGRVALEHQKHAQAIRLATLEAGAQLGDMSLFNGGQASATVKALESCEIYHISQQSMQYMMKYRQDLTQDIMQNTIRSLAKAIRQMNDKQAYTQQYMQGVRA